MDVEAVGRRAGLADVAHLREHRPLDGGVEVGVLEHEERRVAAELHRDAQHLLGRLFDQRASDLGGAGERELARARVLQQRFDHRAGVLRGDHVEHAAGQPGVLQDLREREHRQRRLLRRLDDDRATGGDRRGELAVPIAVGKFHGVTNTHGPTGWRIVRMRPLPVVLTM